MSEEFVIRWEMEEVSKLTNEGRCSPFHYHSDLPWRLYAVAETVNIPKDDKSAASDASKDTKADTTEPANAVATPTTETTSENSTVVQTEDTVKETAPEEASKTSEDVKSEATETAAPVKHFGLYLRCNEESDCDLWTCDHSTVFSLVHRSDEEKNVTSEASVQPFSKEGSSWGAAELIEFDKVLGASEGFVDDDKLIVEVRITVKAVHCIRKKPKFDFSKPTAFADKVALKLDDGVVHVCRRYLMWNSPYFGSLFFRDFMEKNQEEVEIKDVRIWEFTELLQVIFPSERPVNADSYLPILALADRFQIKRASDLAEKYLMKTKLVKTVAKMFIAEQYRLESLMKHCTNSFATLQELKALEDTTEFVEMSVAMRVNLLNRAFELIKAPEAIKKE